MNFLMVCRLIVFVPVVLLLLILKLCGIIAISKVELLKSNVVNIPKL